MRDRHRPGEQRSNTRLDDGHRGAAARAQHGRPSLERELTGNELQQQLQQGDQTLAVRMQEAEIAGTPKALGQHMLQHQPQEIRPGNHLSSRFPVLALR